jgi:N-acetylglucosaminyl-diphospho-decaprenol L-rhamnosyltransferase
MTNLSVIIVTYNSGQVLADCLDAALSWLPEGTEIVVVDNASQDASVSIATSYPEIRVIANQQNRGFGAACNQGATAIPAQNYLFLNPDVQLKSSLEPLLVAAGKPGYGGSTGTMVDPNGTTQRGFCIRRLPGPWSLAFEVLGLNRLLPNNPVNRHYRYLDYDFDRPGDVEQPAGAFLLLKNNAFQQVGGFDESFYPVWFEDVDLARRLKQQGWKLRFLPEVIAQHSGGHSVLQIAFGERYEIWYGSLLRYCALHFQAFGRIGVKLAVTVGTLLRWSTHKFSGGPDSSAFTAVLQKIWIQSGLDREEKGRSGTTLATNGETATK